MVCGVGFSRVAARPRPNPPSPPRPHPDNSAPASTAAASSRRAAACVGRPTARPGHSPASASRVPPGASRLTRAAVVSWSTAARRARGVACGSRLAAERERGGWWREGGRTDTCPPPSPHRSGGGARAAGRWREGARAGGGRGAVRWWYEGARVATRGQHGGFAKEVCRKGSRVVARDLGRVVARGRPHAGLALQTKKRSNNIFVCTSLSPRPHPPTNPAHLTATASRYRVSARARSAASAARPSTTAVASAGCSPWSSVAPV